MSVNEKSQIKTKKKRFYRTDSGLVYMAKLNKPVTEQKRLIGSPTFAPIPFILIALFILMQLVIAISAVKRSFNCCFQIKASILDI
jgi:hypothetical protein